MLNVQREELSVVPAKVVTAHLAVYFTLNHEQFTR